VGNPGKIEYRGACPHDCPDTCALRITVQDGKAVRVQGDPEHPPTHGALCTKVARYPERTYHPDRVLHPLRRTGPKGSGQFERVSWEEALSDIAARLTAIANKNPEAILPYSYAGTMGLVQGDSMSARFFHKLGASLLDRTICSSAGGEAMDMTYGAKVGMHLEHYADSKLIIIWGSNSITSNLHFWTFAQAAKRKGARLWCIDPRRTDTADKCHRHLALRPGTDGASWWCMSGWITTTSSVMSTAGRRCVNARWSGRWSGLQPNAVWQPATSPTSRVTTPR